MKLNIHKEVLTPKGEKVMVDKKAMTLADVFINLLGMQEPKDRFDAIRVFALSQKLVIALDKNKGELEISTEEKRLIEEALDKNAPKYVSFVIGQVAQLLE